MSTSPTAKDLFADAIELPPEQRDGFLEGACGGDVALLTKVRELVAAHERARRVLETSGFGARLAPAEAGEGPGAVLGRYKLLECIGEGGFGTVFMAEQREPVVRRVALKIIKPGMDTRQVIARFEAERQALAVMDHPNIAKVLDAGATESGRPYFVMELVKGEPITAYCDQERLTIAQRLELLAQVCGAVQHAHMKGVIHRDLKPSNVLVNSQDGRPMARVIDFGIAKATERRLTDKTVFTEFRQLIGTPEYMSPEQADGSLDIDTRTDVYSLGVLLYELLTGSTPFDSTRLRSAAYNELQRIIREVEPPRPSTRLSQSKESLAGVAARRRVEPARLGPLIRGELDWIVMKALDKDRGRRYGSAAELAQDLQRFLEGRAVEAAPPSAGYRARKFVRRNRAAVTAGSLVAAALVLGMAGTSVGMVNARRALERAVKAERLAVDRAAEAERSNKIASAVTEFFTQDVLDLKPTPPGQPEVTVREVLDRVPEKIKNHFQKEPAVEGAIRERVGQLYLNMGEPKRAAEYLEAAAGLLERGMGPEHRSTLMAQQRMGQLMFMLGRNAEAAEWFDRVYQVRRRILEPENNFTWNSLQQRGTARVRAGRVEEGLKDVQEAAEAVHKYRGANSRPGLLFTRGLIEANLAAGRNTEALRLARGALEVIATKPELAAAEADFRTLAGNALLSEGRFAEALAELEIGLEKERAASPETDSGVVELRRLRAMALAGLDRLGEAESELSAVYALMGPMYGAESPRCQEVDRALASVRERRKATRPGG